MSKNLDCPKLPSATNIDIIWYSSSYVFITFGLTSSIKVLIENLIHVKDYATKIYFVFESRRIMIVQKIVKIFC